MWSGETTGSRSYESAFFDLPLTSVGEPLAHAEICASKPKLLPGVGGVNRGSGPAVGCPGSTGNGRRR